MDQTKVDGDPASALTDFAAMVTLAQAPPADGPGSASTILNLFVEDASARHRPDALSPLDVALLKSLYAVPGNIIFTRQKSQIATRAAESLDRPAAP